jgi:hypothetical protein
MISLASCQDVAEEPTPSQAVTVEPGGYPSLHTVPPRPQLSYSVEQRRTIVDGLIADRENARYSGDVVRYRAGLSSLPPPAAPAFAAVPPAPEPEAADAAAASTPAAPARDAPVVDPETEFLYEDDDLESFMEEMVDDRIGPPGAASGEPQANAAPPGTKVIRASADRPLLAAYPGRPPVVVLAMPPETATLPAPVDPALAGRAPGVVWGMPDMTPPPAEPVPTPTATPPRGAQLAALPPPSAPVATSLAERAPGVVWGMPDLAPGPAAPMPVVPQRPADSVRHLPPPAPAPTPVETVVAGRAPGVVWGIPDPAPASGGRVPSALPLEGSDSIRLARGAPSPAPAKPRTAPTDIVLAGEAAQPAPPVHQPRRPAAPDPAPAKPAPPAPVHTVLAMADTPPESAAGAGARSVPASTVTGAAPPPAPAKPALALSAATVAPSTTALAGRPPLRPLPKPLVDTAAIELADGLVAIDAPSRQHRTAPLWSVAFDPQSAMLTPDAVARLAQFLAETEAPPARIKVVGEADAPALALDRALAVGLALVQGGIPADRLELTLARGGAGDQARLFPAAPEL